MDILCPVPSCDYAPPANLSEKGQLSALERHVKLNHSIADLPAVSDAMAQAAQEQPEPEPEKPAEAPQEPAEEPKPEPKQVITPQQREARTQQARGQDKPRPLAAVAPIDAKKERINERAEKWGEYLYKDFNPLLVSGASQLAGIPADWLEGGPIQGQPIRLTMADGKELVLWDPPLKEQLSLSEADCKKLAKTGAIFAESTMGQALTMWLEQNAHLIALATALYVAGAYGYRLMAIRAQVGQLKTIIEQQAQMMQPQPASNMPETEVA